MKTAVSSGALSGVVMSIPNGPPSLAPSMSIMVALGMKRRSTNFWSPERVAPEEVMRTTLVRSGIAAPDDSRPSRYLLTGLANASPTREI